LLPKALDAVLFDAGGVLVHLDYAFIAELSGSKGIPLQPDALERGEVHARRAMDAEATGDGRVAGTDESRRSLYFRVLLEAAGVAPGPAAELAHELDRRHVGENLWRVARRGAAETLRHLRTRGLRTAVVSNSDGRLEALLAGLGLRTHFDAVLDSHIEGVEKPDPEIFRRALSRLGVAAERAAYVGDIHSIDAVGARAAGLAPVILDPTGDYAGLDCPVVRSLPELLDRIGAEE